MATPELFSIVTVNGKSYRLQHVEQCDDGSQVWMISSVKTGTVCSVAVAADGSFGRVMFAY